jgi:hypothetical protein
MSFIKIDEKSLRFYLLLVLLLFFIMRIVLAIAYGQTNIEGTDAASYNSYANAINQNDNWLTNPNYYGNYRAPVYPIIIALIYKIFGSNNFLALYIFQAILSTGICIIIYYFSKRLFNRKVAIVSFIWSGFYVFYLEYTGIMAREILVFFLMCLFFYYLYLYFISDRRNNKYFWISIFIFSLLVHTDARYIFYYPFFLLLFITYDKFWIGFKRYFLFGVISLFLLIPWTLRNYIAYDGFILVNTRTLDLRENQKKKMNPLVVSNITSLGNINHIEINHEYPNETERKLIKKGQNPNFRKSQEIAAIMNDIYPDSTLIMRKLYWMNEFWRASRFTSDYFPFPDARFQKKWSLLHNVLGLLCYGFLLPFAFLSIIYLYRKKNKIYILLLFPIVIQSIEHILQWARNRYRMPIDFIIIILGTYGLYLVFYCIIDFYNKRKNEKSFNYYPDL